MTFDVKKSKRIKKVKNLSHLCPTCYAIMQKDKWKTKNPRDSQAVKIPE